MTESELAEGNGLVAQFYAKVNGAFRLPYEERLQIQRRLLVLGIRLDRPITEPDPRAPPGGTSLAMRVA